jgi:LacI family transcriptional regulator, repressor for deo operon, udp, cdd, tsx, nupC, and nupG
LNTLDNITVNPQQRATLTQQLTQQFTWLIASGQLRPSDRLPSVRKLAERLSISVNTVRSVYQKLEAEGLAETRHGAGTRVLAHDAQSLAQIAAAMRSHTVGVILPSLTNIFYHALLAGVEEAAHRDRTMLFVTNTHDDPSEAWRYLAQLSAKHVDGVIVVSHDTSGFLAPDADHPESGAPLLPIVSVDWPEATGYAVMMDRTSAGHQATQHLLAHGHRRVGLITFSRDSANVKQVNAGYYQALREAGIAADPTLIARAPAFDMAAGRAAAQQLVGLAQPPTAIFAVADTLALGAISALKDIGLRIPEDMAVAGLGDISPAALVHPALTTVHVPAREMGMDATKMLQALIAGHEPARRQVVLPTSLVVRSSCGAHVQA